MSVCSQLKFTKYLAHEQASLTMLQEGFLRPEEDCFETSGGGEVCWRSGTKGGREKHSNKALIVGACSQVTGYCLDVIGKSYQYMSITSRSYWVTVYQGCTICLQNVASRVNKYAFTAYWTQSLGVCRTCSNSSSLLPFAGACMYSQRASRGSDIRMLSMRAPGVYRPNLVPRS